MKTNSVEKNKINRFDIGVESFWNEQVDDLFVEGFILGYGIEFLTPSVSLQTFGKSSLTTYFDTTPIKENEFQAKIVLHYEGRTTERIINLNEL